MHASESQPPARGEKRATGLWYLLLPILTAGIFSAVPFLHAASRLERPALRGPAILYGAFGLGFVVLNGLVPKDAAGDPTGGFADVAMNVLVAVALVVVVVACVQLQPLRREVYGGPRRRATVAGLDAAGDPAVARALERRAKRQEARELAEQDRGLARELGIGRPDLGRGFDDGGLIDVNHASVDTLVRFAGIAPADAERIVAARDAQGGRFFSVGEMVFDLRLGEDAANRLHDYAVVV